MPQPTIVVNYFSQNNTSLLSLCFLTPFVIEKMSNMEYNYNMDEKKYKSFKKAYQRRRKEEERIRKLPPKLLSKIDWNTLSQVQERLNEHNKTWGQYDNVYRIYHSSFKMFRLASEAIDLWEEFFKVFNIKPFLSEENWITQENRQIDESDEKNAFRLREQNRVDYHNERVKHLSKCLRKIGADSYLLTQAKMMKNKVFIMAKNGDKKKWAEEGLVMAGFFSISKKIIECSIKMLQEWKEEKGLLWEEGNIIPIDDALVMDSLGGLSVRYMSSEEMKETLRKIIKTSN